MCTVSMVFDHYKDRIPDRWRGTPIAPTVPADTISIGVGLGQFGQLAPAPSIDKEIAELRQLIAEFREAVAAAKRVDVLTKQPDCEDPIKATLEQRVADLERRLNEATAPSKSRLKRLRTQKAKR